MKFLDIIAQDELTRQMAQELIKKSPLLADYVEFFQKPGSAVTYRKGGDASGIIGQTRALGSAYSAKALTPTYGTAGRKFIGDTITMDVGHERMGFDISSEMTSQLKRRVRDLAFVFNYLLIKGDPTEEGHGNEFTGLSKLVTDDRKVKAGGANGLAMAQGNSDTAKKAQQGFLEALDETVAKCEGTNKVIITNSLVISRINSIAREYLKIQRNEFGIPITLYNEMPLINIGDYQTEPDKYSPIIGFNETIGTSNDCASLYVASFEEEDGVSFATTEGGFTVYPVQKVANTFECMFELIADTALIRSSALSKLEGLRL